MRFAGVDGCRRGWVIASWEAPTLTVTVVPDFGAVAATTTDAALVLIDIPIGLAGSGLRAERGCDLGARALLGPRRSSLFPVPVRAAVHAGSYAESSALNHAATGRKLSRQSWGIARKIAETDQVMTGRPQLQQRIRESHPELCFAALNGWAAMPFGKKTLEGEQERLTLLSRYLPAAATTLAEVRSRYPRTAVATDDILDALVLAVAASLAHAAGMPSLPAQPAVDAAGLRMEIVVPTLPPTRS